MTESTTPNAETKSTKKTLEVPGRDAPQEAKDAYQKALRDSYATATAQLRETYADEFDSLRADQMHAAGYKAWKPEPKPAEKAAAKVGEVLAGLSEEERAQVLASLGVQG